MKEGKDTIKYFIFFYYYLLIGVFSSFNPLMPLHSLAQAAFIKWLCVARPQPR